ncbi:MAG: hypothetical protein B7Y90_08070 [Alphaproteobacteria bacterium 32-64-14]|nr:MAG: hypothetical protein B7Y90_08070 [Alphaproteobacteria bacterium 32-64-14]
MACAAAGLAVASGAMAQERPACAIYDELVATASSGFPQLKGQLIPGTNNGFQSKRMLESMYCAMTGGEASAFVCISDEMAEAEARRAYDVRLSRLRACFEGWETAPLLDVPGRGHMVDSLRFVSRLDGGLLSIGAMIGFEDVEGVAQWRAGFGVSWKPDDVAV